MQHTELRLGYAQLGLLSSHRNSCAVNTRDRTITKEEESVVRAHQLKAVLSIISITDCLKGYLKY